MPALEVFCNAVALIFQLAGVFIFCFFVCFCIFSYENYFHYTIWIVGLVFGVFIS